MPYSQFSEPLLKKVGEQINTLTLKTNQIEKTSQTWREDERQLRAIRQHFSQRIQQMQSLRRPIPKYIRLQTFLRTYRIREVTLRAHPLAIRVRQRNLLMMIRGLVLSSILRVRQTIWHIWDFSVNVLVSLWEAIRGVPAIAWVFLIVFVIIVAVIILVVANFESLLQLFQ